MSLILPIAVFLIFYLFIIKPKQAKLKLAQAEQSQIGAGDRVMTRAGIYGRVNRISEDLAVVEVAPGVEMVFDRRSVLKSPETVNVDEQLSDDPLEPEFSDADFSKLHDHLEAHSSELEAVEEPEALPSAPEESSSAEEASTNPIGAQESKEPENIADDHGNDEHS